MSSSTWRRLLALMGSVCLGLAMVTAPGTATVASKTVPGKTLRITVSGIGPQTTAKVRVTGPLQYTKTLRVRGHIRLTQLLPGRYTLKAKPVGTKRAVDRVQTVRIKRTRGAKVPLNYRTRVKPQPDQTAPGPVTNLRLVDRTARSIVLAWTLPEDLLEVIVQRSGGTEYTYRVAAIDEAGNNSRWESITVSSLAG